MAGPGDPFDTVMIDPGHGGEDRGARGPAGLAEKDLVLDVSRRLARLLEERGFKALLTRAEDRFVDLDRRSEIANEARADLFVSVHANAAPSPAPRGVETFFLSLEASDPAAMQLALRENEGFGMPTGEKRARDPLEALLGDMSANETLRDSDLFAKLADRELARLGPVPSRGVKQAPFRVLMGTRMPAVLIEIGFVSNPAEEGALRQAHRRQEIAWALAKAIATYGDQHNARRPQTAGLGPGRVGLP